MDYIDLVKQPIPARRCAVARPEEAVEMTQVVYTTVSGNLNDFPIGTRQLPGVFHLVCQEMYVVAS